VDYDDGVNAAPEPQTLSTSLTDVAAGKESKGVSVSRAVPVPRGSHFNDSVQGWVLPHLMNWLNEHGFDPSVLRRLLSAVDLTDPDARVKEAIVEQAWQLAGAITRDEALGVHLAEWLPRGALDLLEFAFRTSASLGSGLERLAHYGRILSDRVAAGMNDRQGGPVFWVRDTATTPLHPGRAEFALALALKLAREGTGTHVIPARISFAHRAPADDSEHRRFFDGPVHFEAGSNSMALSTIDASRPLLGADDVLAAIVRRRLDKALDSRERSDGGSFTTRVRRLLVQALGEGRSNADGVAQALGVSRRTLSRRLGEEGTSFSGILDSVREDAGKTLLQDRSLSIADIAFFLHYSEPAAFHRSFRRWTGQTPLTFRENARQKDRDS